MKNKQNPLPKKIFDFIYCLAMAPRLLTIQPSSQAKAFSYNHDATEQIKPERLGNLFDKYGSDKTTPHKYDEIYEHYLADKRESIASIFEIGIGTYDLSINSNMGKDGKPGASLYAFSEWAKNALVYGADIDEKILFNSERIETFYLNQLIPRTFNSVLIRIPQLDIAIVDGLHTPRADLNSLMKIIPKMKRDGHIFVEDVGSKAMWTIWPILSPFLKKNCKVELLRRTTGNMIILTIK